jgi:hypothetical protein
MTKRPLVAETWPLTAMPILMTPQWPLVVTWAMFQLPSNGAAAGGGAKPMIAKAVNRAKTYIRLPAMRVPIIVFCCESVLEGSLRPPRIGAVEWSRASMALGTRLADEIIPLLDL